MTCKAKTPAQASVPVYNSDFTDAHEIIEVSQIPAAKPELRKPAYVKSNFSSTLKCKLSYIT